MTGTVAGTPGSPSSTHKELSAGAFNSLLEAFARVRVPLAQDAARTAAEREREAVRLMIEGHITDAGWRELMHKAREAAERGQHECLLLRIPSDACADRGRAIAEQEPGWSKTSTGDAAAIYARWLAESPAARVYPGSTRAGVSRRYAGRCRAVSQVGDMIPRPGSRWTA